MHVQGLGSKVELINTYMKHNDRLATILDHALRPYALRARPAATLSLFLDFNILVSWYTSVLLLEMRERVNDVLGVWRDRSKDVTGLASQYKFPVPWVPQRSSREDSQFYTAIPEDLVEVLLTYLQYARIHKDTVAPSFVDSVGRLDAEVLMAYTSSFLYLAEQLQAAVNSKDWAAATIEEELSEYATWLSSIANDTRRVELDRLHAPNRVADAGAKEGEHFDRGTQEDVRKEESLEKQALKAFRRVCLTSLDHLTCVVFVYVFHERRHLLSDDLYRAWLDTLPIPEEGRAPGKGGPQPIIFEVIDDLSFFLEEKVGFLNAHSYHQLVAYAADKMNVFYLSLFKIAHRYGASFGMRELCQARADIATITLALQTAMNANPDNTPEYIQRKQNIADLFLPLQLCCDLLEHDLASPPFDASMKLLQAYAEAHPHDAAAMASLIETFLGLKGVSKYTTRKKAMPRRSEVSSAATAAAAAAATSAHPMPPAAPSPRDPHSPAPASPVPPGLPAGQPVKRRASMFGFFAHNSTDEHGAGGSAVDALGSFSAHGEQPSAPSPGMHSPLDEEDEMELRKAKELREKVLIDCVSMEVQTVRSHSKVHANKHIAITKSSPLERVFGTDKASEYPLAVQILQSACPPTSTAGAPTNTRYFGRFRGLFGREQSENQSRQLARRQSAGSPSSPHAEDLAESLGFLSLTGLKVEDLFYLDVLRSPHPYLKVQFGNFSHTTKVLVADKTADWSLEEPILVPLRGVGTSESARSSIAEIHISLHYKGFLTDQMIGYVAVEFAPYSPPLFVDKRFKITEFKSSQAVLAAKKAKEEGRNTPSVVVSIAPVNSAASAVVAAAMPYMATPVSPDSTVVD
jgi:hypothetical protein